MVYTTTSVGNRPAWLELVRHPGEMSACTEGAIPHLESIALQFYCVGDFAKPGRRLTSLVLLLHQPHELPTSCQATPDRPRGPRGIAGMNTNDRWSEQGRTRTAALRILATFGTGYAL